MKTRTLSKIILIGSHEAKNAFIGQLNKTTPFMSDFDFVSTTINTQVYQIWTVDGMLANENLKNLAHLYTKDADAFIYLDHDPVKRNHYEALRDINTTIAIDFTTLGVSPAACLTSVETIKQLQNENAATKSQLISMANLNDPSSPLSMLPHETILQINKVHHQIRHSTLFPRPFNGNPNNPEPNQTNSIDTPNVKPSKF